MALPRHAEDSEPTFQHVAAEDLPTIEQGDCRIRLIAGTGFGHESPVTVLSPLVCAALETRASATLVLPAEHEERALIVLRGSVTLSNEDVEPTHLIVLRPGTEPELQISSEFRGLLVGGPPLPERRYLDWNFCSTRQERIEEAKDLYRRSLLGSIPGEGENLPLPEDSR